MSETKRILTIHDFTPEKKAKIPEYIERIKEGVYDGGRYHNFKYENAVEAINNIYEFCGFKKPEVLVAENPHEALEIYYNELKKNGDPVDRNKYVGTYLFALNIYSDSYFTFYDFIKKEFNLVGYENIDRLDRFYELQRKSGVYSAIFLHDLCIAIKYPKKIHVDQQMRLHNTEGVAVEWGSATPETDWKCYYIHGRNVPSYLFERVLSGKYTKEDFINEKNEEYKGAVYHIMGSEKFIEMMDIEKIDTDSFTHNNGRVDVVELYRSKFTLSILDNNPLMWVKFICPSTGKSYLIDVEPKFDSALEAAISTSPFIGEEIKTVDDYKFDQTT